MLIAEKVSEETQRIFDRNCLFTQTEVKVGNSRVSIEKYAPASLTREPALFSINKQGLFSFLNINKRISDIVVIISWASNIYVALVLFPRVKRLFQMG